jgi:Protein of unknown function (DUF1778)
VEIDMPRALKPKPKPNPHIGSDFEDFLLEDGRLEISTSLAIKRMGTNRAEVRCQRDEADPAVTLPTLSNDSTVLSQTAFEAFVATCENPPRPTAALRKLIALR